MISAKYLTTKVKAFEKNGRIYSQTKHSCIAMLSLLHTK